MKKKIIIYITMLVMSLSLSLLSGCGKEKKPSDSQTEEQNNSKDELVKARMLEEYKDTVLVLCDSKANNDLSEFMKLFGYMEGLMKSVVTDEEFSQIIERYKKECGEDFEWSYEIQKEEKVSVEALKDYQELIQTFGSSEELTEAYELTVQVRLKGSEGSMEEMAEYTAGKVGGKWQIVNFNETLLN